MPKLDKISNPTQQKIVSCDLTEGEETTETLRLRFGKIIRTINQHIKIACEIGHRNSRKMIMKGSTMEPKGSQIATKMEPKGCQMATKIAHKLIQNDPGTSNWASPARLQF